MQKDWGGGGGGRKHFSKFIEKILFSLKLFSGHFYGQSFIKPVRGPLPKFVCALLLTYFST